MNQLPALSADKIWLTVFIVFAVSAFIQAFYYLFLYMRFALHRQPELPDSSEPVSVIICARNEAENLDQYLPAILTQQYTDYEVVVVDDCSTDDTEWVLKKYAELYKHLRTTAIKPDKKFSHGKKLAVTIGIKAARHEWLVFTDADCKPAGNMWLKRMTRHMTGQTSIILGYGGYFSMPGALNKYVRYDTLAIALQYFSFALSRMPYMGVGRNLAYRRSLFYSGGGFTRHIHLASGDDDLFVNEHATGRNTAIEYSKDSHTHSTPKQSFQRWFFQKKRHYSTGRLYKPLHKFLLSLEPVSRLAFFISLVALLVSGMWIKAVAIIGGIRLLAFLFVFKNTMNRLEEKNLLVISLLFDILSVFINPVVYISSRIRPVNDQWK